MLQIEANTRWKDLVSRQIPMHYWSFSSCNLINGSWAVHKSDSENFCTGDKSLRSRYMKIDEAVLLIECLLQGYVIGDGDGVLRDYLMRFIDLGSTHIFLTSYTRPSNHSARTSWCDVASIGTMRVGGRRLPMTVILNLQYHIVHFEHGVELSKPIHFSLSEHGPGLILERHSARIRRLSPSRTTGAADTGRTSTQNADDEPSEVHFTECRLSMSMYL